MASTIMFVNLTIQTGTIHLGFVVIFQHGSMQLLVSTLLTFCERPLFWSAGKLRGIFKEESTII